MTTLWAGTGGGGIRVPGSTDEPPPLPVNTVTPEGLHDVVVIVTVDGVAVEVVVGAWTPW